MTERTYASNKLLTLVLGIICIVLFVGIIATMVNYTSIINAKDEEITAKDSQIQILVSQKNRLQLWLAKNESSLRTTIDQRNKLSTWLSGNITYYDSKIVQLQNQIDSLTERLEELSTPKLIEVNLKSEDYRRSYIDSYLYIQGEIVNVGIRPAIDCKLHVIAYQSGGVVSIDTYVVLGIIDGESWKSVDSKVYYTGGELVEWTITPIWTT